MYITVVIPTLNRARLLGQTLQSLVAQPGISSPDCEVVVMDNGSTDGTTAVANHFEGLVRQFRYVKDATPGLHTGRNRAWQESQAEVIAYLDDDVLLSPTWLEGVRAAFADPKVVLAGGPVLPKFSSPPPAWLLELWGTDPDRDRLLGELSIIDFGQRRRVITANHVFGCNFLVRRKVLELTRGFHPDGMPKGLLRFRGDGESYVSEVVEREGWTTIYEPAAGLQHQVTEERLTPEYFCRRRYAQGISDSYAEVRARHGAFRQFKRKCAVLKHLLLSQAKRGNCIHARQFQRSWLRGYVSHQLWVMSDPALKRWVRQEHYLGPNGSPPGSI